MPERDLADALTSMLDRVERALLDGTPTACAHVASAERVALSVCAHHPGTVACAWCSDAHLHDDAHHAEPCVLCRGDVGEVPLSLPWTAPGRWIATDPPADGADVVALPATADLLGRLCTRCAASVTRAQQVGA